MKKLPFTQKAILEALDATEIPYQTVINLKRLTGINDGHVLASNIHELRRKGYVREGTVSGRGFSYAINLAGKLALKEDQQ